jgi:fido (protein-threonine AMPylation protein)
LLKGRFKEAENNPRRLDGTIVSYCPPVQVESQIDELLRLYQQLLTDAVHPVIIAAWVHHAFSTIHPYQDGNGRVDRLLSSLVLIKAGLFPFTVRRRESKEQYITALEKADGGDPQPLVSYFCESQREYIQKALNFKEAPSGATLDEVAKVFSGKMEEWQSAKRKKREAVMSQARESLFKLSLEQVATIVDRLKTQINDGVRFEVQSSSPAEDKPYYYGQIIKYARKHDYYFNRSLPKGWINVVISLNHEKWYTLGFSIHHQGYDDGTLVIGAFLEDTTNNVTPQERVEAALPLDIRPVLISTTGDPQAKTSIISKFVEHALTVALAHISSEL